MSQHSDSTPIDDSFSGPPPQTGSGRSTASTGKTIKSTTDFHLEVQDLLNRGKASDCHLSSRISAVIGGHGKDLRVRSQTIETSHCDKVIEFARIYLRIGFFVKDRLDTTTWGKQMTDENSIQVFSSTNARSQFHQMKLEKIPQETVPDSQRRPGWLDWLKGFPVTRSGYQSYRLSVQSQIKTNGSYFEEEDSISLTLSIPPQEA